MNICFTGKLKDTTRDRVERSVRDTGNNFHKKVTGNTDLLVVGGLPEYYEKHPTSKQKDAERHGTKVVIVETYAELTKMFSMYFL